MTLDDVRALVSADSGLATVATTRPDGSVHATVVNAGVMAHPGSEVQCVAFVAMGAATKLRHFRRSGRASATFRSGWRWAGVEGPVDIIGPEDAEPEALTHLLRAVFTAAGGTHDNWPEYDRVMREEGRVACFVTPERLIGSG